MSFDFSALLSGAFTGGVGSFIGIIGNLGNTWLSMKQEKQNHEYELAMLPLKLNADLERIKADVAKAQEQGAADAFTASQKSDTLDGKENAWAADLKACVRPFCLVALMLGTVAIYTMGGPTQDMKDYITQNVVTDASMAVSWYFGARASALVMQGFKTKAK
jgi:hypothetical protein